jgi:hypothetical protein
LIINKQAGFVIAAQILALITVYEIAYLSEMAQESTLSEESKALFSMQCSLLSNAALCVIYGWLATLTSLRHNIKYVVVLIISILSLDSFMVMLAIDGLINYTNSLLYVHWSVIMHSIDALIAYLLIYNKREDAIYLLNNIYSRITLRISSGTLFAGCLLYRIKSIHHKHGKGQEPHAQ